MDWKKEYRVSDVFRRGGTLGEGKDEPAAPAPGEPPAWAAFADVPPSTPQLPPDPAVWAVFADVPIAEPPAAEPAPAVAAEPAPAAAPPEAAVPATADPPAAAEPPVAAAAPASAARSSVEPSVWKKEIHLFGKRGGKGEVAPAAPEPVVPAAAEPPVAAAAPTPSTGSTVEASVWKKEIHLFGKRGGKGEAAPVPPEPAEPVVPMAAKPPVAASAPAPAGSGVEPSVWKREIHLFGKRGGKGEVAPAPTAPSEPVEPPAAAESPGAAVSPASAAGSSVEPSVWKKEIHLFGKRGGKGEVAPAAVNPAEPAAPAPPEPPAAAEPPVAAAAPASAARSSVEPSVWKKEIHLFGKRKARDMSVPAAEPPAGRGPASEPGPAPDPETPEAAGVDAPVEARAVQSGPESAVEPETIEAVPADVPAGPAEPVPGDAHQPTVWDVEVAVPEETAPPIPVGLADGGIEPGAVEPAPDEMPADPAASAAPELTEPAAAVAPVSVWKKEIRASDLFRRGAKQPKQPKQSKHPQAAKHPRRAETPDGGEPETGSAPVAPAAATSVWKKEIRIGGKRRADRQQPPQGRSGPERRDAPQRRQRPIEPRASRRGSGQGMGGIPDVPLARSINLLPRDNERTRERRLSLPGVAVSVLGLLVVGGLSFLAVYERTKLTERQGDLEDLKAQSAAVETPEPLAEPDSGVELTGEALGRVGALAGALDGRVAWDRLLRELSLTLPEDVWFESLSSTPAGSTVDPTTGLTLPGAGFPTLTVAGYAVDQSGVAQLMARLAVIPQLLSVQLQSSTTVEVGGEDVVQFTILATLAESAGVVS